MLEFYELVHKDDIIYNVGCQDTSASSIVSFRINARLYARHFDHVPVRVRVRMKFHLQVFVNEGTQNHVR